ncbi:MAG: rod shape-determining protein MreD [Gammaproteobacteria bacterium]
MILHRRHGTWVIVASFLLAYALTALPLPEWAELWRPAWGALVLMYWCMAVPQRVGVAIGFFAGLGLDVLQGTLLGQHALAMCIVAFVAHKVYLQVRVLPLWQQGVGVFMLVLAYQGVIVWITGMQGLMVHGNAMWTTPLVSMLLWPWIFVVLRDMRRRYSVS